MTPVESRTSIKTLNVILGILLAGYLFILIPLFIYSGNQHEFSFNHDNLLASLLRLTAVFVAVLAGLIILLPARLQPGVSRLLSALIILLFLQSSMLVWDYGLLDGRAINWENSSWRGWVDGVLWLTVLLAALRLRHMLQHLLPRMAIAIVLLQSGLLAYQWHANDIASQSSVLSDTQASDFFQLSESHNVLHILADGFQADILSDLIASAPEIASAFEGFTLFNNHLGAYPYTHMSVPAILSGRLYRNETEIKKFQASAFSDTIFNTVHDAGYEIDLAVPAGLDYMYEQVPSHSLYPVSAHQYESASENTRIEIARLLDYSFFRATPHLLKKSVYNDQKWRLQSLLHTEETHGLRFFSHLAFLKDFTRNLNVAGTQPRYKYLHLMLSHSPMVTRPDCSYAGGVLPSKRPTVLAQAGCGLLQVSRLFEAMKEQGVYDNTLIVFMADHGSWIPPSGMKVKSLADGSLETINPLILGLAAPAFAIKMPQSRGPNRTSKAPSWIIDTSRTIAEALELTHRFPGENALTLAADDPRERRFHHYQYERSEWTGKYVSAIEEFRINGDPADSGAWQQQRKFLPAGELETRPPKSKLWVRATIE